jgi:hypothetical protein
MNLRVQQTERDYDAPDKDCSPRSESVCPYAAGELAYCHAHTTSYVTRNVMSCGHVSEEHSASLFRVEA